MKKSRAKIARKLVPATRTRARGGYGEWLTDLKHRIRSAQIRAALNVNRELIQLYWDIGRDIVMKQEKEGWGTSVVERLATDLQREFPEMTGFSRTNVYRMRAFYQAYMQMRPIVPQPVGQLTNALSPEPNPVSAPFDESSRRPIVSQPARQSDGIPPLKSIVPQPVGQIEQNANSIRPLIVAQPVRQLENASPPEPMASLPWGHNITLMETVSDPPDRLFYARKAIENGWSRNMLSHWIDSKLHERQGKAVTNFKTTLPPEKSDLALQIIIDPYNFDFLTLREDAHLSHRGEKAA